MGSNVVAKNMCGKNPTPLCHMTGMESNLLVSPEVVFILPSPYIVGHQKRSVELELLNKTFRKKKHQLSVTSKSTWKIKTSNCTHTWINMPRKIIFQTLYANFPCIETDEGQSQKVFYI